MVKDDLIAMGGGKIIAAAIENQETKLESFTVQAMESYHDEASKYANSHHELPPIELAVQMQAILAKSISNAVIKAFHVGFMAGMNSAFDVIEAKAMELGDSAELPN